MCKLCDQGQPQDHSTDHQTGDNTPETAAASRRGFLKTAGLAGAAGIGAAAGLLHASPATAQTSAPGAPAATGTPGRRYVIKGGAVLSMDSGIGDFAVGDVLVDGKKIVAVGPNIDAGGADVVEAGGMIIMPGFIDTHHHQFETALRSFLADGLLFNDGKPHGAVNYFDFILGKFAGVYRPQDVYINELFGSLSQLDAGVTTVHDISQIHHSPEHSDAAIKGIVDSGRRAAFGYFEGHGPKAKYPGDARRIKTQYFSSDDQLVTMIMGGEIYRPNYDAAWTIGRDLGIPVAAHIVGSLGMSKTFSKLIAEKKLGPDNLFIHMSAMPEDAWKATKDAGAGVSVASPIEMTMRHGMPPILTYLPGAKHTYLSDVNRTRLPDSVTGYLKSGDGMAPIEVGVKDSDGRLLETAIPKVNILKEGNYTPESVDAGPEREVDILALMNDNFTHSPLAGFVIEGQAPYGTMTNSVRNALAVKASYCGMPVVRVGRGNNEGFAAQAGVHIGGGNLTSTKARLLLLACLMKFGGLPPATDPDNPTAAETAAILERVALYQAVFDTH